MFGDYLCRFRDNIAFLCGDESLTYGALLERAADFSSQLGSGRQLVALFCSNDLDSVIAYFGCLLYGHVALLLDAEYSPSLHAPLLEQFKVSRIWKKSSDVSRYVLGATAYQAPIMHADLRLLLSTSGSTGSKKLVRLSEKNIFSNALSIAKYLELTENERPITTLPMNYSYGLSVINSHAVVGATIVLNSHPVTSREFWDVFARGSVTSFSGVPFTYQMLQRLRFENMSLPSLRYFTQAGGKLPAELASYLYKIADANGSKFYIMYGQTEATARISYLPYSVGRDRVDSIGVAIPGGRLSIEDASGYSIQASGERGELVYYGDNVMMGYALSPDDLSHGDEMNGRLSTGDVAVQDENGYYYIVGRLKRFVKINGNRIGLDEVESFLISRGFSVAVVGDDDLLKILVEDSDGAEVVNLVWSTFSIHPRNCRVLGNVLIPRNESGKIVYADVAKTFLS